MLIQNWLLWWDLALWHHKVALVVNLSLLRWEKLCFPRKSVTRRKAHYTVLYCVQNLVEVKAWLKIAICVGNKDAKYCIVAREIFAFLKRSKYLKVTLEGGNYTFDPCYTQDFSYDCYANHTIGLLKRLSVFYSTKCEVILCLKSYC